MSEAITAALREHAEKIEQKAAADRAEINKLRDENGELATRLAGLEQEVAGQKAFGGRVESAPSPAAGFIASEQLQAMRDGATSTGRVQLKGAGLRVLAKAISNTGLGQSGDTPYNVQPNRDAANLWNTPQRALTLLEVLRPIPVTTATFEYIQLTGASPIAGVQAKEGDGKQEQSPASSVQTANIATVAHYVRASQQVMDDAPALDLQLNNLLTYGCMAKLEAEVINGSGGAGQVKGLVTSATAATVTATAAADRIGEAMDALAAAGWRPSLVILNPKDWGKIQRERAAGDGQYVLGSARDPAPPALWSVPVVTSASLAEGTALVLDDTQVALLDRAHVAVMASREDGSNFTTNMVTILAELRAGLAVFSPGAVLSVDLTPTT